MGWLRRLLGDESAEGDEPPPSADEAEEGELEREIVEALHRLRTTTAREVMTPRVDVIALEVPVDATAVAQAVKESGHSRFPVYEDDLDHLVGVLFVKDLFRMGGEPSAKDIRRRLRKPFLVPESRRVLELLQEMRQHRIAFAVVVDEYGGVEGVLTIKDLVSELVGELRDEFDAPEHTDIVRVDNERWLVDGQAAVDEVADHLGVDLPEGDYVTIGGYLFAAFGRIPEEGDCHLHDGWEFRVQEMARRRIAKVIAKSPPADWIPEAEAEPAG